MSLVKKLNNACESIDFDPEDNYDPFEKRGDKFIVDGKQWWALADWQPKTKKEGGYPLIFVADNVHAPLSQLVKKYHLKLTDLKAIMPEEKGEQTIIIADFEIPQGGLSWDSQDLDLIINNKKNIHMLQFEDNTLTFQMYQEPSSAEKTDI